MRYDTITFLSDFGRSDEFVGVVHSVLRSLAPHAHVIDLSHDVAPYDVRGAGLLLARSAPYLAPGVVLAVVDPGVGTDRRPVAVEVGDGSSVLVGPDNGVLAPVVALVGGADRAVELRAPDYRLDAEATTFDGRDVFAPAAAHLAAGVPLDELGPAVDPATLMPGTLPVARREDDTLVAEVLWVDRYGNAQLNADPDDIADFGDRIAVRVGDQQRSAALVTSFDAVRTGDIGVLVDSAGLLALVAARRSAATMLGLAAGTEVTLAAASDRSAGAMPVELSPTRPRHDHPEVSP